MSKTANSLSDNWIQTSIFLFAFGLYANTLLNGYALDDHLVTTSAHPQISKGLEAIPEIFATHYVSWNDYNVDYRPLVKAIFAIEYQLFGESPKVGHLINVLLYGLTCVLLFQVLIKLFPEEKRWKLLGAILLFTAHPVHTEVAASIKGRDELLSMLFMVVAFLLILKWAESGGLTRLILFGLCVYLSIICKLSGLPWLAIMAYSIFILKRKRFAKVATMIGVSLVMVALHVLVVYLLFDSISRPYIFIESPYTLTTILGVKWPSNIASAGYYLKLLVAPFPLCSYYGYDQISMATFSDWRVYTSLGAYAGLILLAFRSLTAPTIITVGALILLVDLSPMYNIVYPYPGIVGERALYGATLGFGLMVMGLLDLLIVNHRIRIGLLAAVVLAGSVKTFSRNFDWKDNLTLFAADAENCDRSAKLQELHGLYLRGKYINNNVEDWKSQASQSIQAYHRSIDIYDKWPIPYHRIGVIYHYDLGQLDSAKAYYLKAVELNPDFEIAVDDLIQCLRDLNDHEGLAAQFHLKVEQDPSDPDRWNSLVAEYFLAGDTHNATTVNAEFLGKFPQREEPYIHKGNIVMAHGDTAQALVYFAQALKVNPENEAFRFYLEGLKAQIE